VRARVTLTLALIGTAAAGCGQAQRTPAPNGGPVPVPDTGGALKAKPQAIDPNASGPAAPANTPADSGNPNVVSVGPPSGGALAQPVSDAQVRQELASSGLAAKAGTATLTPDGLAIPPVDAPGVIKQIITAGNQIAKLPYRFGGGHGTFIDNAYDCSGSISFVFAAAGLLNTTVTSSQLMGWGLSGAGKWITVFANNGHTFMYIAGLRFDTVALAQSGSRWSNRSATEGGAYAARHYPGL
jgi:cell wall-associated NlpC family hydrolase